MNIFKVISNPQPLFNVGFRQWVRGAEGAYFHITNDRVVDFRRAIVDGDVIAFEIDSQIIVGMK